MKHCFISPTSYINNSAIGGQSDFLLVLSHLLDDKCINTYSKQVIEFGKTKPLYLDNGLFENGSPEIIESLINKAIKIEATYTFAPDILYDCEATEKSFDAFYEAARTQGYKGKFAYVIQAENVAKYLTSFKKCLQDDRIDLIGLSILTIPYCFQELTKTIDITINRLAFFEQIDALNIEIKKDCHLLGLGESLLDLLEAQKYSWIKSNDSSSAFQSGKYGKVYKNFRVPGGKVYEKVDFKDKNLKISQLDLIQKNISIIKSIG